MQKRKKRGRPPLPPSERRTIKVHLNVTRAERARLAALAKQKGVTMTALLLENPLAQMDAEAEGIEYATPAELLEVAKQLEAKAEQAIAGWKGAQRIAEEEFRARTRCEERIRDVAAQLAKAREQIASFKKKGKGGDRACQKTSPRPSKTSPARPSVN